MYSIYIVPKKKDFFLSFFLTLGKNVYWIFFLKKHVIFLRKYIFEFSTLRIPFPVLYSPSLE